MVSGFVAYPSEPPIVAQTVATGVRSANGRSSDLELSTWEENDIAGQPLVDPIHEKIRIADVLVADISKLNFNVTYEIGYAIGAGKPVFLIRNKQVKNDHKYIQKIGIFDTLGYLEYDDSDHLSFLLRERLNVKPLQRSTKKNDKLQVYVVQTPVRGDAMSRIIARIKKTIFYFTSFDPSEQNRMSAVDAFEAVATSAGIVVPLLADEIVDSEIHNIRAAFVAGLSHGLKKPTLILQHGFNPIPLDLRDFVRSYRHPNDINDYISEFAELVSEAGQEREIKASPKKDLLAQLDLGSSVAENEFQTLSKYYFQTDQYREVLNGDVNLVVGRKGSGKTALFSRIRDRNRADKKNVVVDLKPEGFQLVKFKEQVLDFLEEGTRLHLAIAFWEYVLLLEIAYKILEKDRSIYLNDHDLYEPYLELEAEYDSTDLVNEGDFSERLLVLAESVGLAYAKNYEMGKGNRLNNNQIMQLLYKHDLKKLRDKVSEYLKIKGEIWVLFDNIDKGWSTDGIREDDLAVLVRALIDASRKIEREMQKDGHDFHSVVFLRNDVYELLVSATSDRGKDVIVTLDTNDSDLLRQVLRKRLIYNGLEPNSSFHALWNSICVSHFEGEESSEYLVERSLFRPRYLINLVKHCKSAAVNVGHYRIESDDIMKGIELYSSDLVTNTDYELTDIFPKAAGLIYSFIEEETEVSERRCLELIQNLSMNLDEARYALRLLLWYGFLGVIRPSDDPMYIHNANFNMKVLEAVLNRSSEERRYYTIHPAFWPALELRSTEKTLF